MKFKCSQKYFLEGILTVQRAVSSRTTLPILEGIYIETVKDVIKLVGTDLNLGIECFIAADIFNDGSIVIPARIFSEIIRKLPDADVTIEVTENYSVKIDCYNSSFTIQGFSPDEYPEIQEIEENFPFEIEQDLLKDMVRQTVFAVAVDETRPILTGALMEIEDDRVNMVCLDGYRLALKKGHIINRHNNVNVVIPGKSLNEISKVMGGDDKKVSITIGNKHILFDMGYTRITSRLMEGEFINYKQIIPDEYNTRVKLDSKILFESIERASLLAREGKNNLVKFSISDNKMIITSNSEAGRAYEEIPIFLEGEEMEIAFNARYFIDVLNVIDDEEIYLDFTTNISPCVIRPVEGNQYTYLLLPVRINS